MNLLVRADSSPAVGAGHVMRCLALGQACVDRGGRVILATPDPDSPLFVRLRGEEGLEVAALPSAPAESPAASPTAEADSTAAEARRRGADWVAVDGYRFDDDYQLTLKSSGSRLLALDDFGHADFLSADLVLNQNAHAEPRDYPAARREHLLLGPRYALLRREFASRREWRRKTREQATRVLVTLGGGEPGTALAKVLCGLAALERSELTVRCLIGPLAGDAAELRKRTRDSDFEISFESPVAEMPELMAWADVAVSGGGSTCWELAFMGLPALIVAHNAHQERIAQSVEEAGAALYAGTDFEVRERDLATLLTELLDNRELRRRMTALGRGLVDGRGAERVVEELESRLPSESS